MFLHFQIKYSRFFAEILSFSFYLSNYECGACLAVDQSLVYGNYPNMFLLFFSLILSLIPVLKPSFLIHVLVSFCFSSGSTGIMSPCLFIFHSQWDECFSIQAKGTYLFELFHIYKFLCFYLWYRFLLMFFCFYPWFYILNVSLFSSDLLNIFRSPSTYSVIYSEK